MAEDPQTRVLYLVDGTSQLFRAYYALPRMTNDEGLPTQAVYGFTTMLRKLLEDEQPAHLAVAFDPPGSTFRKDEFAEYKSNRPPAPEDLSVQRPYARQVCEALGVPVIEYPRFEADDVIATYARQARDAGYEVVIVASDKDLLQLVTERVTVLNPSREERLDVAAIGERFGLEPLRMLDVQGLMGDTVDNIPGVPGVGEKTALSVVRDYGDLETVLDRATRFVAAYSARDRLLEAIDAVGTGKDAAALSDARPAVERALAELVPALDRLLDVERDAELRERLAGLASDAARLGELLRAEAPERTAKETVARLRETKRAAKALDRGSARRAWFAMAEHADQARLSKRLATLDQQVPVEQPLAAFRLAGPDLERTATLFEQLGFRSLLADLGQDLGAATVSPVSHPRGERHTITSVDELIRTASLLEQKQRLVLTVQPDGPDPLRAGLVGIALSDGEAAWFVPLGAAGDGSLDAERVWQTLESVLAGDTLSRVGHDTKATRHLLRRAGLPCGDFALDTMLAAFLLDSDRRGYGVDRLAGVFLGQQLPGDDALTGAGAKQVPLMSVALERIAEHATDRAVAVGKLADELRGRLESSDLAKVYDTIDGPLLPVLGRMEARGIRVDCTKLASMSRTMERSLERLRGEIHDLAGEEFNVDSPKQLREVLFDKLSLRPRRKTAKSRVASTDAQTLEELAAEHAIAGKLLEYRELAKLQGTYVDTLPKLVDPQTGRVHTRFDPTGAATGRLSSVDPNLQNIPVRTEAGRQIRSAFVAEDGWSFLSSDYSQIELRVLAHLAGDENLAEAFRQGEDIHRYTASKVFGVMLELVSSEMRRRAKAVNFGILYGMSETRLAREQGMSRTAARRFIQAYFDRFSSVRAYIDGVREQALQQGEVRTLFGRVRHFPQLRQRVHRGQQEQALRAAVNATIQGTAADLMKLAMLAVDRALSDAACRARILLQVHDELLLEVPDEEVEAVRGLVAAAMEGVPGLAVPLRVDQKVGRTWLEVV